MKLSLLVQVYNGGTYWQECWRSILECQDLFDQIFVSISKSPSMEKDIALIQDCRLEKLHWVCQNESLTARDHGKRLDQFVASFQPEGHIFILCHDDILLREGVLQIKQRDLQEDETLFGPFHFFSQDQGSREMIVHEFHRQDGMPVDKEFFILMQDTQQLTYNISGLVMPSRILSRPCSWHLLRYGCFSETCHLVHPMVNRIIQNQVPAVKIRWHASSEGANMKVDDLTHDSLLYHLQAFPQCREYHTKLHMARSILYLIRINPLRGAYNFIRQHFLLAKLDYCYPKLFLLHIYVLLILFQKGSNFAKRLIKRCWK